MAIQKKDIAILWGNAAGRCSKPSCKVKCIQFLDNSNPTIVGEMAHIIAKKENGPRGVKDGGSDIYENLILLCPTHHTEIDKAPEGTFSVEELIRWKTLHEKNISESLSSPKYTTKNEMANMINRMLIHNHTIWENYGPESKEALSNPLSNMAEFWKFRKLGGIVPYNRKIINIINNNLTLIAIDDLEVFYEFIEHAEGFERNCYDRTEGVLRFPQNFRERINNYVT